jgi:hypothetical protein
MAFIQDDDKLLENQNQDQQNQAGQQGSSDPAAVNGGSQSTSVSGEPVSTAGVGAGGQGGWVNLQSYLNANAGNTSTADKLNSDYGGAFDKEESQLNDQSSQAKTQAEGEASKLKDARANERSYVDTAVSKNPTVDKDANFNAVKGYLNNAYSGPQSFNYDLSQQTKDYGENVNRSLPDMLSTVYDSAAGGRMTSGQRALQNQLDTNNDAVTKAQSSLRDRYSALTQNAGLKNQETQDAINNAMSAYNTDQAGMKSDLDNLRGGYENGKQPQYDRANAIRSFLGMDPMSEDNSNVINAGDTITPDQMYNDPRQIAARDAAAKEAERQRQLEQFRNTKGIDNW